MRDRAGRPLGRLREGLAERVARYASRDRLPRAWSAVRPPALQGRTRRLGRLVAATLAIVLSLGLIATTAGLDGFLHRGTVFGTPSTLTPLPAGGGPLLGMNVFLEKEANRDNVLATIRMLQDGRVTFVRQTFSWAEIEPLPGQYRDLSANVDSWEKYDFIVEQLAAAGIGILARVDTIPRWARPPTDDFARRDKGPPEDFNNYANFVGTLAARYLGKIAHFQVWNEPNLDGEWGGKPISPAQYGLLLKLTSARVRAANPAALVVTAGLAQTIEDGVTTNNLSELAFIQGLYDAGARDAFDILSVMAYGLGHSPEDRRVGAERTNFSRLLLVREIMERNGDAAKPVWVSEFGWVALPQGWKGPQETSWGDSVGEDTQARYLVAGLERARREWPWIGAVFVWGFRWVERPEERPDDPARHFEVVDYDFTPRPAFVALREWSAAQAIAQAGPLNLHDARLDWRGAWRAQQLAGREYRVAGGAGAAVRLAFDGTDVQLRARTGPAADRVYVTIDDRPVAGLTADARGSYVSLDNGRTIDQDLPLASGLTDGVHLLELRAAGDGELALNGIAIGRRQPFAWAAPILFATGLGGLFAGLVLAAHAVAAAAGWRPDGGWGAQPGRRLAWWDTRE